MIIGDPNPPVLSCLFHFSILVGDGMIIPVVERYTGGAH